MRKINDKGITLVVLVSTVIILLILAGVTTTTLQSSNLFEKARLAKEKSDIAEAKEQLAMIKSQITAECTMNNIEISINQVSKNSILISIFENSNFSIEQWIENNGTISKQPDSNKTYKYLVVKYKNVKFKLNEKLEIESINDEIVDINADVNNNVKKWLEEANIYNTFRYEKLEDVLNDTECLRLLMESPDAYNYLLNTTSEFQDEIWKSQNAKNAIISAGITVEVPRLSSNENVLYGEQRDSYYAYYAFDSDTSTKWITNDGVYDSYIGYDFKQSTLIYKISLLNNENYDTDIILRGSNDGENWEEIEKVKYEYNNGEEYVYDINCTKLYKMYIIEFNKKNGYLYDCMSELQFYCISAKEQVTWKRWAEIAGLNPNNYTSLSNMLEDNIAVQSLINSYDANKYIVNCNETLQNSIMTSSNVVNQLANNLSSVKNLLASKIWSEDIFNNEIIMENINENTVTIPIITSNNDNIIYEIERAGYPMYYAFDNNVSTSWISPDNYNKTYLGYDFNQDLILYKIGIGSRYSSGYTNKLNVTIQGSNDRATWEDIQSINYNITSNDIKYDYLNSNRLYSKYRILFNESNAYYLYDQLHSLQFYCF